MTTGMIVFWVVVGLLVVFACWLMIQAKHPIDAPESRQDRFKELVPGVSELFKAEYDKYKQAHEQAPYKLEPPNASDLVAIHEQAPYKLEPPNASDIVAISDQPEKRGRPMGRKTKKRKYTKRKYIKRSEYWTKTKRAKTKKSK